MRATDKGQSKLIVVIQKTKSVILTWAKLTKDLTVLPIKIIVDIELQKSMRCSVDLAT